MASGSAKEMTNPTYYYADASKKPVGPYSLDQLRQFAASGVIVPTTKVIRKGDKAWVSYSQLPAAPKPAAPVPPVTPSHSTEESAANEGGSFLTKLPKPLFFGMLGAFGCLIGWLLGEPVLMTLKESDAPQSTRVDGNQTTSQNQASVLVFRPEMPKPVFRAAIQKRLEVAGAEAGAIEIALLWNTYDDLDLHCIDPRGSHIFYSNKRSPSGGWLDVDMNAGGRVSLEPVEHIRWPEGKAPEGEYQVSVNLFSNSSGTNIPFTVAIKANNEIKEFKMTTQGVMIQVPVHTFRIKATNVVVVTNAPPPPMIPVNTPPPPPSLMSALIMGIWTALLAIFISLLLVMGQNYYTRRPLLSVKTVGAILVGGTLAGLVSGITSQYLFSLAANTIMVKFPDLGWLLKAGLVVGWMLLGGLLGAGMGWFIPNLPKIRAGFAGVIGGFIGALAFLMALTVSSELVGRMAGTFILGFAIGLMVALVEQLARKAWLVVNWTPNQASTVNLGEKPVTIGGSSNDDIRVKGLAENALSIVLSGGRILCTQQPNDKETELKNQSVLKLGNIRLVIHSEKDD